MCTVDGERDRGEPRRGFWGADVRRGLGSAGIPGRLVCTGGTGGLRSTGRAALGCTGRPGSATAVGAGLQAGVQGGLPASRDGMGCGGGPGAAQGLTAPPGSWVELRCGPGCPEPEPAPSPFSCHADVERMLLEAQLETESSDGALLVLGSPAWDDDGASHGSDQPGESEVLPAHSQPQPGCPHPRQRDVPQEAKWRQRRLRASLGWACARCPRYLAPEEFAFVCSPQPVLWSLQGGAVGRKKRLFSSELLLLFIPSLLLSHLLTLGLGIYIGKRLAASSANPL